MRDDPRPLAGPSPVATYRLQLHAGFGFDDARRLVPYLHRLGVSHLYLSPVLAARPGSTHGYDVVDPTRANPALGGEPGFEALVDAAHERGMGVLLDIVPNHMGAGPANPYWLDVLALGRESPYADWFDVDWGASHARGRIVLPVLGDEPDAVLARDELRPALVDGRFVVRYYEHLFPLDPRTVHRLFAFHHTYAFPDDGRDHRAAWAPVRDALQAERGQAHSIARATAAVRDVVALVERSPAHRAYVDATLARFAEGEEGRYRLQALLDLQRWRLAHWRQATRELHFRRFFDVNELVAVRVEDPIVFAERHDWLLERVRRGLVDGIRVDHVDGLRDPHAYLDMLRAALDEARPDARVPIYVEKILSHGEALRPEWPIDGTTGYEALNALEAVFVDPAGLASIEETYRRVIRARAEASFARVAARGKEHVLRTAFRPEIRRLVSLLTPVVRACGVEHPPAQLAEALLQLAIALPVYRTYVRPDPERPEVLRCDADDRRLLDGAVARALGRGAASPEVLRFVAAVLAGEPPWRDGQPPAPPARRAAREVALRFQQASGPATAKGIEDTALYRWFPLASLCEVGGEPDRALADAVGTMHAAAAARAAHTPTSLVTVTTHDTKRSADVRARLDALTEVPGEWRALVARWHRRHAPLRARAGRRAAPDPNVEYLLYQTLVGIWPVDAHGAACDAPADDTLVARVQEYLTKATREAKAQTSWTHPHAEYEAGVLGFARTLLADDAGARFRAELSAFVPRVARAGWWNALTRTLLQVAGPGTPDVYQGDEGWNLALVDPDNRRPVDWDARVAWLDALDARPAPDVGATPYATPGADATKLHVLRAALLARRADPMLFGAGAYVPLAAEGERARHVVACARMHGDRIALAAGVRLPLGLRADGAAPTGAAWCDTVLRLPGVVADRLGGRVLRDAIDGAEHPGGETLPLASLMRDRPLVLLVTPSADGRP